MTTTRQGDWMQTYTGRKFWPLDPRADDIVGLDIAHSLSMQCRYAGHCNHFYSVAEHSVLVSTVIEPRFALYGLLHDAPEAYLVDVPRPVKPYLTGYAEAEDRVWRAVCEAYDLDPDNRDAIEAIKRADNAVLAAEQPILMPNPPEPWPLPPPATVTIRAFAPEAAKQVFSARLAHLTRN